MPRHLQSEIHSDFSSEAGVWVYENATLGEIARAYGYEAYPWLATWNNGFTGAKIVSTYIKTTNYPIVP